MGSGNIDLLLNYARYLYENELARTDKLNDTSKTYIVFISSTFTVLLAGLTWIGFDQFAKQIDIASSFRNVALLAVFAASITFLVLSFIFVVLSVKIRSFERLCEPLDFLGHSENNHPDAVKKDMMANFAVATTRNYDVNQSKARWLFRALMMYLFAFVLFLVFAVSNIAFVLV